MALPPNATKNFKILMEAYHALPIEFPHLKAVTAAQWAMESGWGKAALASRHGNYAGMKWGSVDQNYGTPVRYGTENYTQFTSLQNFIEAYWHRLDAVRVFAGWRERANPASPVASPEAFLFYIAPAWLNGRGAGQALTADERKYVRDILSISAGRMSALFT